MDGYLYMYGYRNGTDPRAGRKIEDATAEMYGDAYNIVKRILDDEANIPSKVKRNILRKMALIVFFCCIILFSLMHYKWLIAIL